MKFVHVAMLVALAAIWGSSFLFLRLAVPAMGTWGPFLVTEIRLILASVTLVGFFSARGMRFEFRRNWRVFLGIGLLNTAVPFTLFALSAWTLPAAVMVILNGTVPFFGALFSRIRLGERLTPRRLFGLALGIAGVSLVVSEALVGVSAGGLGASGLATVLAVSACLVGSLCYATASVMIKVHAAHLKPMVLAGGSQVFAALALVPVLPVVAFADQKLAWPGWNVIAFIGALAFGSTAIAYVLYFKLVAEIGPTRAGTVTFLMPLFGMFWGALFLGEQITGLAALGCGLILVGVRFVLNRK